MRNPLLFVNTTSLSRTLRWNPFDKANRSLWWPITNECVNCLLLATLVGMRSAWAAGVHIHTYTHALLIVQNQPTNQQHTHRSFGSVSSFHRFYAILLRSSVLCSGAVAARGKIGSIRASFLDNHQRQRDARYATHSVLCCCLSVSELLRI